MKKLLLVLLLALTGCSNSAPNRPEYALIASEACKNLGAELLSWENERWVGWSRESTLNTTRITIQCSDRIQVIVDYNVPVPVVQPRSSV